jgi:crotonobetainyl-CoA:carnitine CoA-transferase CaiB-like acyl-CoA transferase
MAQPIRRLLTGLKVLEFGQIAAGPFAGSLLADLGADVVKVERPDGGDGMRTWPPLTRNEAGKVFSENFASVNRNKRSIAVDLKDPQQLAHLKELCRKADILIENFRPGVLRRLGLGYEELSQTNSGLVYCSLSGCGQSGPNATKGAFDVTVQAMSGLMSVTGEEGGAPVKCGVPVGDFCAGLYGAFCVLACILERQRSGHGGYIDCPMLGSLLGVAALQTSEYFGTQRTPKRLGSAHPRNAPYQAFQAEDDYFVIAAGNDRLWREVCEAVEMPELEKDPRFVTQELRAKNQHELLGILESSFKRRPAAEWLAEMDRRGVPCAPINTYPQILSDPQVAAMGLVADLKLPNGVMTRTVRFPIQIHGYDFQIYRPPPDLGADTEEVFAQWLKQDLDG